MRFLFISLVGLSFFMSSLSRAESVKASPIARKGCVPQVSLEESKNLIQRFHLKPVNATSSEIRTIGTGLMWIEKLNNNRPLKQASGNQNWDYQIQFFSRIDFSRQTGHGVEISRNGARDYGNNVAQIVHELGHFVGNNGIYDEYSDAIDGKYCNVSSYSMSNLHEQFAEIFAAFVTRPSVIKNNKSVGCQRAYRFMQEKLFAKGELAEMCMSGPLNEEKMKSLPL